MLQVPLLSLCLAVYFQANETGHKCGRMPSAVSCVMSWKSPHVMHAPAYFERSTMYFAWSKRPTWTIPWYQPCVPSTRHRWMWFAKKVMNLRFWRENMWWSAQTNWPFKATETPLEKLFELLKIKRSLMPKKTPGHPLLDEPDNSKALDAQYAKIYRSCICIGLLLYISSDYLECQYTIRALSQSMSQPTMNSFACLRHLCMYLLGCTQNCLILTYKGHRGLLHWGLHLGSVFWHWLGETLLNQEISFLQIHIPIWKFAVFKFTFTKGDCTPFSRSWNLRSSQCMLRWSTFGILLVFHCWRNREGGHLHQDGQFCRQILSFTFWCGTYCP